MYSGQPTTAIRLQALLSWGADASERRKKTLSETSPYECFAYVHARRKLGNGAKPPCLRLSKYCMHTFRSVHGEIVAASGRVRIATRREHQARLIWADRGDALHLKASWTKGGKERDVPISRETQRDVLNEARALAPASTMSTGFGTRRPRAGRPHRAAPGARAVHRQPHMDRRSCARKAIQALSKAWTWRIRLPRAPQPRRTRHAPGAGAQISQNSLDGSRGRASDSDSGSHRAAVDGYAGDGVPGRRRRQGSPDDRPHLIRSELETVSDRSRGRAPPERLSTYGSCTLKPANGMPNSWSIVRPEVAGSASSQPCQ